MSASVPSPPPLRYNFAKGHPHNDELPVAELQHLLRQCASTRSSDASDDGSVTTMLKKSMQYGQESGNPELIAQLRLFLDRQCMDDDSGINDNDGSDDSVYSAATSSIFITEGVSHSVDLLVRIATRPGDVVWCEQPTYYLVAGIFRSHGLTVDTLPMRRFERNITGGIDVDALSDQLAKQSPETVPRLIYVIPAHQNPTGYGMSVSDRRALAQLARQYNILVVADEVYHLLDWSHENDTHRRPARMVTLNPTPGSQECEEWQQQQQALYSNDKRLSGCVSVSSFTKIFAPGVRCGWIEAPPGPILDALRQVGYIQSQGAVGPVMSSILHVGLRDGTMDRVLQRYRHTYQRRCHVLCRILQDSALDEHGALQPFQMELTCHPTGGYFVWVRFPNEMGHVNDFLNYCIHNGVSFMPGPRCNAGPETESTLSSTQPNELQYYGRLCFAKMNDTDIENGAVLLVQCFRQFMADLSASSVVETNA